MAHDGDVVISLGAVEKKELLVAAGSPLAQGLVSGHDAAEAMEQKPSVVVAGVPIGPAAMATSEYGMAVIEALEGQEKMLLTSLASAACMAQHEGVLAVVDGLEQKGPLAPTMTKSDDGMVMMETFDAQEAMLLTEAQMEHGEHVIVAVDALEQKEAVVVPGVPVASEVVQAQVVLLAVGEQGQSEVMLMNGLTIAADNEVVGMPSSQKPDGVPVLKVRKHWATACLSLAVAAALVVATLLTDKLHHAEPPSGGAVDMSAPVVWVAVCGAVIIFGCVGIMIKTPSVEKADCDCMVFQVYNSAAVVVLSLLFFLAGSSEAPVLDLSGIALGALAATLWILSRVLFVMAIKGVGLSVSSAVCTGATIFTSFTWGVAAFDGTVKSVPGTICSLCLMVLGICLSAGSSLISDRRSQDRLGEQALMTAAPVSPVSRSEPSTGKSAARMAWGLACALGMGIGNGTMMVPLTVFQRGSPTLGVRAFDGADLAALAFLPSLAVGVLVAQPLLFLVYWGPAMYRGVWPRFHFASVALPGFVNGAFWCMGNFCAMFTTIYLGQAVGYSLTQLCLVLSGLWGILYFREIQGGVAIATFSLASVVILSGAVLYSLSC